MVLIAFALLLALGCFLEHFGWFNRLMDKGVRAMTKGDRNA